MVAATPQSMINFDRSQRAFFEDESRVQVVNWHRQKGKDFTAAAKAVDDGFRTGNDWYIVSLTQRQADETFKKACRVADAIKRMLKIKGEIRFTEAEFAEYDAWLKKHLVWTKREIVLPNGARIISLPGRDPDTLAGFTGNLILTEFGLFPNGGYDHWSVLFPIVTRGKYKVIVISTPRGKNTKFYELCSDPATYSYHLCDIYKSVLEEGYKLYDQKGAACDIPTFRKLYNAEAKWPREYECKFTGDLEALITYAQLLAAAEAGRQLPFGWCRIQGDNKGAWTRAFFSCGDLGGGRLELGWDVARTGDLASLWCNHAMGTRARHLRFLVLMHNTTFALQREVVQAAMEAAGGRPSVGAGDATGMGMDSNETLKAKYGDKRWLPFTFTAKGKSELGSIGKTAYDGAGQTLPATDGEAAFVAADLAAVQADRSGGTLRLDEGENHLLAESHCDIAYSNFLSLKAGGSLAGAAGGMVTW